VATDPKFFPNAALAVRERVLHASHALHGRQPIALTPLRLALLLLLDILVTRHGHVRVLVRDRFTSGRTRIPRVDPVEKPLVRDRDFSF
jgi:hypothetical protein